MVVKMPRERLDSLLDVLAAHFSHHRDTLDVIGRFGNRFEDWFKWECAAALHRASYTDLAEEIGYVAVECKYQYDLFAGSALFDSALGFSPEHEGDVWLELKARCTRDKGPSELAGDILRDQGKLLAWKQERKGHCASLALIVSHPEGTDAENWIGAATGHLHLQKFRGAGAPTARVRRIWRDIGGVRNSV